MVKLVYYNGLGCLMKFPSCNGADAYDLAEITQYRGVFALPEYKAKELLFTEIASINYLELTQHSDSPDFSSELNQIGTQVRTENDLYQVSNFNRNALFLDLVAKQLPKENRVALILTAGDCIEGIEINSEERHYKTAWGNKLSILDSQTYQKNEQSNLNHSSMLTAVNQASMKFWNNADRNDQDTWSTNQDVIDWLMEKHKFSQNIAKAAATIVRPEWAKK